ncbi:S-adenosyl-L-methionine-dependent methyltransferase [Tribonema minus]|uniref:S-adenosyl-L-methionine-dependent methyltransferase n=2 Tax=Tribonema minus TaxID=303371 RepID=A0A836CG23_9STRA|nr:S-adenosyl-L-methionine-dependent methyltransferase [Tribonema minus]
MVLSAELGMVPAQDDYSDKAFAKQSYDTFASSYDGLDGSIMAQGLGIDQLRQIMTSTARGRVLEVAVGTGLNLPYYRRDRVSQIDAVDLSPSMLAQAEQRGVEAGLQDIAAYHEMDVEQLKFRDGTFDTVVDTFGLCVFGDPVAALREMGRVCATNGRVLLLENSKSEVPLLGAYQDLTAGALSRISKGCVWNQDVEALARSAGLTVVHSYKCAAGLFRAVECTPGRAA